MVPHDRNTRPGPQHATPAPSTCLSCDVGSEIKPNCTKSSPCEPTKSAAGTPGIDAPDYLDRFPPGAELHKSCEFLAASAVTHRHLVCGLLPAYRPRA